MNSRATCSFTHTRTLPFHPFCLFSLLHIFPPPHPFWSIIVKLWIRSTVKNVMSCSAVMRTMMCASGENRACNGDEEGARRTCGAGAGGGRQRGGGLLSLDVIMHVFLCCNRSFTMSYTMLFECLSFGVPLVHVRMLNVVLSD